ncbi:hypothetical protein EDB19DRAFT_497766 [Suillus lakei]|nr:hypothetical protein EDB19DRAFT_497766 [Suillus lakei]
MICYTKSATKRSYKFSTCFVLMNLHLLHAATSSTSYIFAFVFPKSCMIASKISPSPSPSDFSRGTSIVHRPMLCGVQIFLHRRFRSNILRQMTPSTTNDKKRLKLSRNDVNLPTSSTVLLTPTRPSSHRMR